MLNIKRTEKVRNEKVLPKKEIWNVIVKRKLRMIGLV